MNTHSLFIILTRILFYILDNNISHFILTTTYFINTIYNILKNRNIILFYDNFLTLIILLFFDKSYLIKDFIVWVELFNLIYYMFKPTNRIINLFMKYYKIIVLHCIFESKLFYYNLYLYLIFTLINMIYLSHLCFKKKIISKIINNPIMFKLLDYKFYWKGLIIGLAYTIFLGVMQYFIKINSYYYICIYLIGTLVTYLLTDNRILLHKLSYGGLISCGLFGYYQYGFIFLDKYCLILLIFEIFKRFGCLSYGCCYGKITDLNYNLKYKNKASYILIKDSKKKNLSIYPLPWLFLLINLFITLIIYRQYYFISKLSYNPGLISGNILLIYSIISLGYEYLRDKQNMDYFILNLCKCGILLSCIIIIKSSNNYISDILINGSLDYNSLLITFILATLCNIF